MAESELERLQRELEAVLGRLRAMLSDTDFGLLLSDVYEHDLAGVFPALNDEQGVALLHDTFIAHETRLKAQLPSWPEPEPSPEGDAWFARYRAETGAEIRHAIDVMRERYGDGWYAGYRRWCRGDEEL